MVKQHSSRFLAFVTEIKKHIKITHADTLNEKLKQQQPVFLIDVREDNEWLTGHIPTAIHMTKGIIERDIEIKISDMHAPIVVYCSGGLRSALVANNLQAMGYTDVHSLEKGMQGWLEEGYALEN